jgi:hypothetical protein
MAVVATIEVTMEVRWGLKNAPWRVLSLGGMGVLVIGQVAYRHWRRDVGVSVGSTSSAVVWVMRLSGGVLVFAGAAAAAFVGNHDPAEEQLASPHSPGLSALERARQARLARGTASAQRLGGLDVAGRLGEPQVGVVGLARQQVAPARVPPVAVQVLGIRAGVRSECGIGGLVELEKVAWHGLRASLG